MAAKAMTAAEAQAEITRIKEKRAKLLAKIIPTEHKRDGKVVNINDLPREEIDAILGEAQSDERVLALDQKMRELRLRVLEG